MQLFLSANVEICKPRLLFLSLNRLPFIAINMSPLFCDRKLDVVHEIDVKEVMQISCICLRSIGKLIYILFFLSFFSRQHLKWKHDKIIWKINNCFYSRGFNLSKISQKAIQQDVKVSYYVWVFVKFIKRTI